MIPPSLYNDIIYTGKSVYLYVNTSAKTEWYHRKYTKCRELTVVWWRNMAL